MMTFTTSRNSCKPCKKKENVSAGKKIIGLIPGIFLALLPKCPYCFVAFSGSIMLCGNGGGLYSRTFSSPAMLIITALTCLITLFSVILNFRDRRTKYAIVLVALGSALTIFSVTMGGGLTLYYLGVVMIFAGAWLNASLLF